MRQWKLLTVLFGLLLVFLPNHSVDAATLLHQGSKSGDVWDLQYRLNIIGYYQGRLDGVYGKQTTNAVRRFQYDYGLKVDGVVGPATWAALHKVSVNQQELSMLARLVYGESRGEPYVGQVGVAAVVMNRLQSPLFPTSIRNIIFQPGAFTALDDGQYWLTPDQTAYKAAWEAVRGFDPTYGALYYFNPDTATSAWIWSRPQTVKIGKHIFAR